MIPTDFVERVYPEAAPWAQANGRWSWTNPPVAQIPKYLRDIFIPDPGWPWIEWDWDQIELRLQAALSNDKRILEALEKGWDVHTILCCDCFNWGLPPNLCDPHNAPECAAWRAEHKWGGKDDKRRIFAKRVLYKDAYGGEPKTAWKIPGAQDLGLNRAELEAAVNRLRLSRPEYELWRRNLAQEAIRTREVRDFTGRRRRLSEPNIAKVTRQIYDYPMQQGVSSVYNLTAIQIAKAYPEMYKVPWGMHDNQKWACPVAVYDYGVTLAGVRDIVEQEWDVSGIRVRFPATFAPRKDG